MNTKKLVGKDPFSNYRDWGQYLYFCDHCQRWVACTDLFEFNTSGDEPEWKSCNECEWTRCTECGELTSGDYDPLVKDCLGNPFHRGCLKDQAHQNIFWGAAEISYLLFGGEGEEHFFTLPMVCHIGGGNIEDLFPLYDDLPARGEEFNPMLESWIGKGGSDTALSNFKIGEHEGEPIWARPTILVSKDEAFIGWVVPSGAKTPIHPGHLFRSSNTVDLYRI